MGIVDANITLVVMYAVCRRMFALGVRRLCRKGISLYLGRREPVSSDAIIRSDI